MCLTDAADRGTCWTTRLKLELFEGNVRRVDFHNCQAFAVLVILPRLWAKTKPSGEMAAWKGFTACFAHRAQPKPLIVPV